MEKINNNPLQKSSEVEELHDTKAMQNLLLPGIELILMQEWLSFRNDSIRCLHAQLFGKKRLSFNHYMWYSAVLKKLSPMNTSQRFLVQGPTPGLIPSIVTSKTGKTIQKFCNLQFFNVRFFQVFL
jgi:hypothetical protein